MRRFNYDDSDDKEEVDNMFNDDDDDDDEEEDVDVDMDDAELAAMMEHHKHQEAINWMQVELAQQELDQRLLANAIKMCQKGWFWKFKSWSTQLKEIAKTYMGMYRIIENVKLKRTKEG